MLFSLSLPAGPTDGAVKELAHGRHRDEWGKTLTQSLLAIVVQVHVYAQTTVIEVDCLQGYGNVMRLITVGQASALLANLGNSKVVSFKDPICHLIL